MPLTPAQCDQIRAKILAEPRGRNPEACCFLLEKVLGMRLEWYSRIWVAWWLAFIRTILLAKRGLGKSYVRTGVTVYRILCDLERARICTISKTDEAATELNGPVRGILETNEILKQVFGTFVGRARWTDGALTVAQRVDPLIPEATLEARGIESQLARCHFGHVDIDDGQDEDRARSEALTERDWKWLFTTLRGALLDRASVGVTATPYAPPDLVTRLEDFMHPVTGEVRAESYDIEDIRANGLPPPSARWMVLRTPAILSDGSSIDPARFPLFDRVEEDGTITEGLRSLEGTPGFETQQLVRKPVKAKSGARELVFREASLRAWTTPPDRDRMRIALYFDPSWVSAQDAARRSGRDRDPDFFAWCAMGFDPTRRKVSVLELDQDRLDVDGKLRKAGDVCRLIRPDRVAVEYTNLQVRAPGARAFYDRIARALGMKVSFHKPQKSKIARAELGLAVGMARGEVEFDPAILERKVALGRKETGTIREMFIRFGDPDLEHDDPIDASTGAYALLMGPTHSLKGFAEQGSDDGGSIESVRAVPRTARGVNRFLDQGGDDYTSARAVPR